MGAHQWMNQPNGAIVPALVRHASGDEPLESYCILGQMDFGFVGFGNVFDLGLGPRVVRILGELMDLDVGDLICINIDAFARCGDSASWRIVDAKTGIVDSGSVSWNDCLACASLPSTAARLLPVI